MFFFLFMTSLAWGQAFPENFKWCVATSAHQIEGNNIDSDWWDFEQVPGRIRNNDRSGNASDHWNRVAEDIGLIKELNATDYRLSIEWARIEPVEGQIDQAAVQHYADELAQLQAQGIRPIVTLHHFTFPLWLAKKGGWEWAGSTEAFARFTRTVYGFAGAYVTDWVTLNEPVIYTLNGYVAGVFPPGEKREVGDVASVFIGMLKAHAEAYHLLHAMAQAAKRPIRVGIAHSVRTFDPWNRASLLDIYAAERSDAIWNWAIPSAVETGTLSMHLLWFVNVETAIPKLKGTQDFFGVNYYSGDLMQFSWKSGLVARGRKNIARSDMGWDIYPKGLTRLLKKIHQRFPRHSILVTENGVADAQDSQRPDFLVNHLRAVQDARAAGVPVEGYCYWSLLDNFEWAEGFGPRFGLYFVDYVTGERRRTSSAEVFTRIAGENQL